MQAFAFLFLSLIISAAHADFGGRLRLEQDSYLTEQKEPVDTNETSLTVEIEAKYKLTDWMRLRIEPKARVSTAEKIIDDSFDWDTRDTQLEMKFGNFRTQIGSFVKVWEGTDGLNPMDIASMKNLRDPLAGESLSSLGITLAGGEGFFTWDALYVPQQTKTRLPGENSPWLPRQANLPLENDDATLIIPDLPVYEILDREEHNDALKNNYGLRMQLHGKSWDFSVAGFEGAAQTPFLFPEIVVIPIVTTPTHITGNISNPIRILPVDYRRQSVAGVFVYTHDTWIFRFAGRHDQPIGDNPILMRPVNGVVSPVADLPTWSDQYVGGFEKTVTIRDQSVIFSLQGAYGNSPESGGIVSVADVFRRAVLAGVRWPWSDELLFSVASFWETQKGGGFARFGVQKKISDPLTLDFAVEGTEGPDDSALGVWKNQKRATAALLYQF